jgi:release factor glutamine methyltransferase
VNPRDLDVLLADTLGRSMAWLFAHGDEEVDEARFEERVRRRLGGEPLQYIRGMCHFYGRELSVDERVLIPRPETELLVEQALLRLAPGSRVLDVGTGSGCIAVSLALERADLRVSAVDASVAALAVAKRNRDALGARVALAASDVLSAVRGAFDLVVSNPPYIPAADVETLAPEVRDHEPRRALTPGPRGTEVIERLLAEAHGVTGRVMFEIGYGQADEVRALAAAHRWTIADVLDDLAGIARVVVLSAHGR